MINTKAPRNLSKVLVPLDQRDEFEKRLKALNAKAAKFKLSPIVAGEPVVEVFTLTETYSDSGDYIESVLAPYRPGELVLNARGAQRLVRMLRIELEYPVIKLGEWQVVAQVERLNQHGQNLLFVVTKDEADQIHVEQHHRSAKITCQHCNVQRARSASYILKDATTGEYKEVGSTCLKDFTGIDPAAALFLAQVYAFYKVVDYRDEDGASYGGRATSYSTREYLQQVLFMTERQGFISSKRAKDEGIEPTYRLAESLPNAFRNNAELLKDYQEASRRLFDLACTIRDWYASLQCTSTFDQNVQLLLASDDLLMDSKHLAFAAAAVPAYHRHLADKANAAESPSKHVGVKGDKLNGTYTVIGVSKFEHDQYGPMLRLNFRDTEGNRFSWKTGAAPGCVKENDAVGRAFVAKFKVKGHSDFKGLATTEVSHLKIEDWGTAAS